jgi:hypothetical protein
MVKTYYISKIIIENPTKFSEIRAMKLLDFHEETFFSSLDKKIEYKDIRTKNVSSLGRKRAVKVQPIINQPKNKFTITLMAVPMLRSDELPLYSLLQKYYYFRSWRKFMNIYGERKREQLLNGEAKDKEFSSEEESDSDKDNYNNSSDVKSPGSIKSPTTFVDKRRSQIQSFLSSTINGIILNKIEIISPGKNQKQIPKIPTVKEDDEYKSKVSISCSSNSESNKEDNVSENSLDDNEGGENPKE